MNSIAEATVGSQLNAASAHARRNLADLSSFIRIEADFHSAISRLQRFQSIIAPVLH